MTQEEKSLLLKDLSARLPYGTIVKYKSREKKGDVKMTCGNIAYVTELGNGWWKECKPYLRPMSSMTEEEKKEFESLGWRVDELDGNVPWNHNAYNVFDGVDWLNKKMFDYRGLIPKGLAIAVTKENNPYNISKYINIF